MILVAKNDQLIQINTSLNCGVSRFDVTQFELYNTPGYNVPEIFVGVYSTHA